MQPLSLKLYTRRKPPEPKKQAVGEDCRDLLHLELLCWPKHTDSYRSLCVLNVCLRMMDKQSYVTMGWCLSFLFKEKKKRKFVICMKRCN